MNEEFIDYKGHQIRVRTIANGRQFFAALVSLPKNQGRMEMICKSLTACKSRITKHINFTKGAN